MKSVTPKDENRDLCLLSVLKQTELLALMIQRRELVLTTLNEGVYGTPVTQKELQLLAGSGENVRTIMLIKRDGLYSMMIRVSTVNQVLALTNRDGKTRTWKQVQYPVQWIADHLPEVKVVEIHFQR